MASRLSSSAVSLEIELTKVGEKLVHLPSSTEEIIKSLVPTENILSMLPQSASISMIKPLNPIIKALIAEDLVRHSNMAVKISVACCICDVGDQEFFELVVTVFEKVSSSDEGYTKMIKVLKALSSGKFVVMMCHLQLDGLIVRLFRRFLTATDSNSSAVVSKMEKIMTMIIKESKERLVNLLAMSGKSKNEIASPVRVQLAKKVLKNYVDQLNPDNPDTTVNPESEKKTLAIIETPMPSKSVTTGNGKRKKQIQSVEHGENLVGSRIKVWWPEDNTYYKGTVKSFDHFIKKHKVWHDDGDKESIDLKKQKWELVEEIFTASPEWFQSNRPDVMAQSAEHGENGSGQVGQAPPPGDIISVQGYSVKQSIAPILEAIFNKHGDILADCSFQVASVRTCFLEVICEVVKRIESSDVSTIISDMEDIQRQVSEAHAANINVSWLRDQLKIIHTRNEALKKTASLKEMKVNTIMLKRAARTDLIKRCEELVAAQERCVTAEVCIKVLDKRADLVTDKPISTIIAKRAARADMMERCRERVVAQEEFEKAERCVTVLNLVENKLSKDILESQCEITHG
ncbi:phospholipase-like protein [Tanacetum coccineum]